MKFNLLVLGFVIVVSYISLILNDWLYAVRMVQSGRHEPLYILLGLVLGFTMRARTDEDSISALLCAIGMAVLGLLVGGLDINNPGSAVIGFILTCFFFSAMLGTVVYLLNALKKRMKHDEPTIDSLDE
ncbi:hypothetical protein [Billgrantia desiderata]|uniref:hypothetical protein n=1 Tax=Billgrantia desiderata TaxID=52021 RepID=UPI00089E7717|nr:hypothetical protein [Halomonas desiderata]SEG34080.1 hypothetical protein SAMN04487953_12429 [Halomonas desiderata]